MGRGQRQPSKHTGQGKKRQPQHANAKYGGHTTETAPPPKSFPGKILAKSAQSWLNRMTASASNYGLIAVTVTVTVTVTAAVTATVTATATPTAQ